MSATGWSAQTHVSGIFPVKHRDFLALCTRNIETDPGKEDTYDVLDKRLSRAINPASGTMPLELP
jgi:hypothetical protein